MLDNSELIVITLGILVLSWIAATWFERFKQRAISRLLYWLSFICATYLVASGGALSVNWSTVLEAYKTVQDLKSAEHPYIGSVYLIYRGWPYMQIAFAFWAAVCGIRGLVRLAKE